MASAVADVPDARGRPDRHGTSRLGAWEKVSYGLGDFAGSLCWNAVGAFLLYYYINVALLPVAAVGTLFLVSRLLDAGIDIGVGVMVDKTRSRWGRTRPWLIYSVIPFGIFMVLTFLSPGGSAGGKLAYAYATFIILGILYSLVAVPYSALMPMMTNVAADRMQLGSSRAVGTSVSVIVATVATMPLVALFGHGDERRGFPLVMLLFAAITLLMIGNLVLNCRERHYDDSPPDFQVVPAVRDMIRNRAWLVTFLFTVLNFIRFGAILSVTAFFAIEVLHKPWMISVLLPAISGTLLLGAFIAPPILRRTGIRKGCIGALIAAILLYLFLPMLEGSTAAFLSVFLAASILISVTMTSIFTMAADSVDYHQATFGCRNEGLLSSGISLSTKIGMALGTAAVAYTLAAAGYQPKAMTPRAHDAIRWSYYGWAIGVMIVQIVCISFWPMDRPRDGAEGRA